MTRPVYEDESDTLLKLEQQVVEQTTKPLKAYFRRVLARLYALWPGDDASAEAKQQALRRLVITPTASELASVQSALRAAAVTAVGAGIDAGSGMVGRDASLFKQDAPVLSAEVQEAIDALGVAFKQQTVAGRILLRDVRSLSEATEAVVVANPEPRVKATSTWVVNKAANEGVNHVAQSAGVRSTTVTVWRAERDGCVHCLAYQGQVRRNGAYPVGLTFGNKPLSSQPVAAPPLHPHCRCTQWILDEATAGPVIAGLVREAKRSVLRGFSLPGESNKARVDAAAKLLARGSGLPRSVETYARSAVRKGRFARGRNFPGRSA